MNSQNDTLKQYSELKLTQEKTGWFVLKRYFKLPDGVASVREKSLLSEGDSGQPRMQRRPDHSQLLSSTPNTAPSPTSTA